MNHDGTSSGDLTFTKAEYLGGEDTATFNPEGYPTSTPLWRLSGGTGVFQLTLNIETTVEDESGNKTVQTSECSGTASYEVSGDVYRDMKVMLECP